jgi:hypothetical protein
MILEAILAEKGHMIACRFSVMTFTADDSGRCVSLAPYV